MATIPIEVSVIGNVPKDRLLQAVFRANSVQDQFVFLTPSALSTHLSMTATNVGDTHELLHAMEEARSEIRGYHPFSFCFTDAELHNPEAGNRFGDHRGDKGLAVVTTSNVSDVILPSDRIAAYFLYHLVSSIYAELFPACVWRIADFGRTGR